MKTTLAQKHDSGQPKTTRRHKPLPDPFFARLERLARALEREQDLAAGDDSEGGPGPDA